MYGADQPQRAEALGIALQLINIMRDVDEDWSLGRVYIPQDELASFGVSEDDIAAGRCHSGLAGADGLPGRARAVVPRGGADACSPYLDRRSAACVGRVREPLRGDAGADRGAPASTSSAATPQPLAATKLRIVGSGLVLR